MDGDGCGNQSVSQVHVVALCKSSQILSRPDSDSCIDRDAINHREEGIKSARVLRQSLASRTKECRCDSTGPSGQGQQRHVRGKLRSRYQSQSKQASRSDSPEPPPFPKPANIGLRIWQVPPTFPHANQGLHGLPATGGSASVLIADGLSDELRNTGALLPRPDMQCLPDVFLKVELSSFHDV